MEDWKVLGVGGGGEGGGGEVGGSSTHPLAEPVNSLIWSTVVSIESAIYQNDLPEPRSLSNHGNYRLAG